MCSALLLTIMRSTSFFPVHLLTSIACPADLTQSTLVPVCVCARATCARVCARGHRRSMVLTSGAERNLGMCTSCQACSCLMCLRSGVHLSNRSPTAEYNTRRTTCTLTHACAYTQGRVRIYTSSCTHKLRTSHLVLEVQRDSPDSSDDPFSCCPLRCALA